MLNMGFKRLSHYKYSKLRRKVYERDGGQCVLCGGAGAHIHHIIFRSQGGKDEAENLVTLCGSCHENARSEEQRLNSSHRVRSRMPSSA